MRLLLIVLSLLAASAAEATERIAVLELGGSVEPAARSLLTDRVREGVLAAVRGREFAVMTRENMAAMARDMGLDLACAEASAECEVDLARNIGADFVVSGSVSDFAGSLAVALKLHETAGGSLLASKSAMAKDAAELFDALVKVASQLSIEGLGAGTATAAEGRTEGTVKRADLGGVERAVVAFDSKPPGAVVLVDGEILCQATPCSREVLEGQHRVEMRLEDHTPFVEVRTLGRDSRVVASLEDRRATLILRTDQQRTVKLDGRAVQAPGSFKVDPGPHEIRIDDPCVVDIVQRVSLDESESREVRLSVRDRMAGLDLSAKGAAGNAVAAEVLVDGQLLGTTPFRGEISLCSKQVQLRGTRGVLWERELRLQEGQVSSLVASLSAVADPSSGQAVSGSKTWLARVFDADQWVKTLHQRADGIFAETMKGLSARQTQFESREDYEKRKAKEKQYREFVLPFNRGAGWAEMTGELARLRSDLLTVPASELSIEFGRYDAERQLYSVSALWKPPGANRPARAAFILSIAPAAAQALSQAPGLQATMRVRPRWNDGRLVGILARDLVLQAPDGTVARGTPAQAWDNHSIRFKVDNEGLKGAWGCVSHDCFFVLNDEYFRSWAYERSRTTEGTTRGDPRTTHVATLANDVLVYGATDKGMWSATRRGKNSLSSFRVKGIRLAGSTAGLYGTCQQL